MLVGWSGEGQTPFSTARKVPFLLGQTVSTASTTRSGFPLLRVLSTTIGKKFVMAITGLLLCGFLVAHFAGNVLLFVGPKAYNDYTHALHEQEALVKVAEAGLVALFALHIYLAVSTWRTNAAARRKSYNEKHTKRDDRTWVIQPDTWMFISGVIVLGFLLLHLADFTWELRPDIAYDSYTPYEKAEAILKTPVSMIVYAIGTIVLAAHLLHGFASAFQSLGLNHPKYNGLIKWCGFLFALVFGLGFTSFVVVALLEQY